MSIQPTKSSVSEFLIFATACGASTRRPTCRAVRLKPLKMQPRAVSPFPLVAKVKEKHDGSGSRLLHAMNMLHHHDGKGLRRESCSNHTRHEKVISYVELEAMLPDAFAREGWQAKLRPTHNHAITIIVSDMQHGM